MAKPKQELAVQNEPREVALVQGTNSIAIMKPETVSVYDDIEEEEDGGAIAVPQNSSLGIFRILQNGSPECQAEEDGGLGVRPGTIINTQTKQVYDGRRGIYIVVARTHLLYPEYIKREKDGTGGGFLGIHEPGSPEVSRAKDERMKQYGDLLGPLPYGQTEEGKPIELIETYYADCICVLPDANGGYPGEYGELFRGSFPFSSTNIPVYNAWMERQKGMTYPKNIPGQPPKLIRLKTYGHVWLLKTRLRKRGAQNWMVWDIDLGGTVPPNATEREYTYSRLPTNSPLYQMASDLRVELLEGAANLDFAKAGVEPSAAETGMGGGSMAGDPGPNVDDIPFDR